VWPLAVTKNDTYERRASFMVMFIGPRAASF
jgi:hypothetical protein